MQTTPTRSACRLRCTFSGKLASSVAESQGVRGGIKGSQTLTRERFFDRAVGTCPEVEVEVGGVKAKTLLDTGSQVSTISEAFFQQNLLGENEDITPTAKWLELTAANSFPIQLDVQTMGLTVPECEFLVVRDSNTDSTGSDGQDLVSDECKTWENVEKKMHRRLPPHCSLG